MKIPTAEETYLKYTQCVINNGDIKKAMIEFARLHTEAALKEAIKNGEIVDISPYKDGDNNFIEQSALFVRFDYMKKNK
jgi:hypothetical protein